MDIPDIIVSIGDVVLLRDLVVASVGAFIAYYAWDHYQSPSLNISGIERKEVISSGDHETNRITTTVDNSGVIAAKGCEIQVWMEVKMGDSSVAVSNFQAGWVDKGGDIFVGNDFTTNEVDIGPNEQAESDIIEIRHDKDGIQIAPGYTIGNKNQTWTVINPSNRQNVESAVFEDQVLIHDGDYVQHKPYIELMEDVDYLRGGVRVTAENSPNKSSPLKIEYDSDDITIELDKNSESTSVLGHITSHLTR